MDLRCRCTRNCETDKVLSDREQMVGCIDRIRAANQSFLVSNVYQRRIFRLPPPSTTLDTLIGAIELWDFKVCNEAQNG